MSHWLAEHGPNGRAITPIEIGLTAAIVAVEADEPRILVAGDAEERDPRRPAVRPVRSAGAPHLRDRAARLGGGADRAHRRLCRAALHLRRPRPPCAAGRHRPARGLGRLSRADPHVATTPRRCARPAPASSRGTASSRGRTGATAGRRSSTTIIVPLLEQWAKSGNERRRRGRSAGASGCGSASASAARRGTRRRCSTATSCSTRPAWSRRRARDGREAAVRAQAARARRADALRPPPHPRDRDRAAARQAEIPPGGVRADAAPNSR